MINFNLRKQRAEQFRQWYDTLPTAQQKSASKRRICATLQITGQSFYDLLSGRVFINNYKQKQLTALIGKEIFV